MHRYLFIAVLCFAAGYITGLVEGLSKSEQLTAIAAQQHNAGYAVI